MLKINDIAERDELDLDAMQAVEGGIQLKTADSIRIQEASDSMIAWAVFRFPDMI